MSDSLRTVILQELKARFPAMTWKLGSLVRTLIVEPLASLGDTVSNYIQEAENSLDVTTICNSPAQYPKAIDTWMNRLGIESPEIKTSSGVVAILSETGEDMVVAAGTMFTWGDDLAFQVVGNIEFNASHPYTKLNEGAYLAEVPVVSTGETGASLSAGAPLNWEGAPAHVYDIYTASPITGGRTSLSYQAKATLILNALSVKSFVGEEGISNALQREFPNEVVNAKAGNKDAKKLNVVPLYIKPSFPPSTITLQAVTHYRGGEEPSSMSSDSSETPENTVEVSFSGTGIISVDKVLDELNSECTVVSTEVQGNIGDSDSTVTLTLSGVEVARSLTIYCTGFSILRDCAYWLNAENQGLPFRYIVKVPAVAIVSLFISGTETLPLSVRTEIQSYIDYKPLDASVTDGEISAILQRSNITTTGANLYSAYIINNINSNAVMTSVGVMSPAGNPWVNGRPVAMYSYVDKIKANV